MWRFIYSRKNRLLFGNLYTEPGYFVLCSIEPLQSHGMKEMGENGPTVAVDRVIGSDCV